MKTIRNAARFLDEVLDRHHYETIVWGIGTAMLIYVVPRRNELAVVETAFTLDWILAAIGLGVLIHLLTRK